MVIVPSVPPHAVGAAEVTLTIKGVESITTSTQPGKLVHEPTVCVTQYTPLSETNAFVITGLAEVLLKLLGPVQLTVAPPLRLVACKVIVPPEQFAVDVKVAVGGLGSAVTTTVTELSGELQDPKLWKTL